MQQYRMAFKHEEMLVKKLMKMEDVDGNLCKIEQSLEESCEDGN